MPAFRAKPFPPYSLPVPYSDTPLSRHLIFLNIDAPEKSNMFI
ncbi:hypothetical protein TERTU_0143 [Teredinibacter turnerae T7901]|uniref:Uncharacterized protein n=1 Tax=Teredinibacter turnerae (strain ATCC 39867 / T7901) TaxID=377629 RepID=C5BLC9_TERTT|nr:hypothetical protein TERTU_0143 [Teredinibacter turnerae T7901]